MIRYQACTLLGKIGRPQERLGPSQTCRVRCRVSVPNGGRGSDQRNPRTEQVTPVTRPRVAVGRVTHMVHFWLDRASCSVISTSVPVTTLPQETTPSIKEPRNDSPTPNPRTAVNRPCVPDRDVSPLSLKRPQKAPSPSRSSEKAASQPSPTSHATKSSASPSTPSRTTSSNSAPNSIPCRMENPVT